MKAAEAHDPNDTCPCPMCRIRRGLAALEDATPHLNHARYVERRSLYHEAIHAAMTDAMTPVAAMHDIPLRVDQEACIRAMAGLYLGICRSTGLPGDYGVLLLQQMNAATSRETDRRLS